MKDKIMYRNLKQLFLYLLPVLVWLCFLPNLAYAQATLPNFVNTEQYAGSVSSVTVDMPSGSQVGDVVFVNIVTDDDGAITHPGAFTEVAELFQGGNGPTNGLYYRVIDGTEAATYNFTFPSEPAVVTVLRYGNQQINSAAPINVSGTTSGNNNNPLGASVTTTVDGKTVLQFIGIDGASAGVLTSNSSTATVISTAQSGNTAGCEMMIAAEYQATAGATPVGSFSFAAEQWASITVALNTFFVSVNPPANDGCAMGSITLSANYGVASASGNFELLDPSGMVIATESYTSSMGTISFNFTPALSGDYTIREQTQTAISGSTVLYVDTDGDMICDLFDIDDDNDGTLDHIESPNCFLSFADVPYETGDRTSVIDVTSQWTVNSGTLANILNGNTTDNAVRKANGDFTFSGQEFLHFTLSNAVTFDAITLYHEGAVFLDVALVGVVQGSNDGIGWTDLTTPGGTVLPDDVSPHTITLTQNLADYSHYRIFVNSGQIDDDEWLREVEFSMIFNPSLYPIAGCMDDADDDLVANHLDLDSDGDTCSDALEAGATTDATPEFQFPSGGSGANGLPDAVESMPESGVLNYTSTYVPNATLDGIRPCVDSDGDSVIDANDDDDDNDGIPDSVEDGFCNLDYDVVSNKQQIQISSTAGLGGSAGIEVLLNGVTSGEDFWYLNGAWAGDEVVRLKFPAPTVLTGLEYVLGNSTMIDNGTVTKIQGSIDGATWVDMSPPAEFTKAAPNNTPGVLSSGAFTHTFLWENTTSYTYYRLLGVSGGGNPNPFVHELFFRTEAPALCDIDGDGLPNSLDLDSDGDGIPDNVEAQTTTGYVAPNADSPTTYAANNGVNSAYTGSAFPIPDTDMDGTPDFLDEESDSDRILDAEESGLSLTGVIEANGLDMGVATSADYSDVNGVVNNPDADLAKVTTLTTEVDYRDKQPPPQITVCYNNESYGIGGGSMSFHDEKLLNPANFGEFGVAYYQFVLKNLGNAQNITSAMLAAEGCQIFFMGGTEGEAGSFTSTSSFSATALDDLRDWGQSPNNVIIAFQGHAVSMGGTELVNGVEESLYEGRNQNSNPNMLTMLGETVISGDFGTTESFNQGGGFQGHFTMFPDDACVISEDGSGTPRPTGLINGATGDFYFADFGLVDETSAISNSANITQKNYRLFANLMTSAARVVVEGPDNVCSFFLCPAGDEAPILTTDDVTSSGVPVDLTQLYTGTPPPGTTLTWHTATLPADSNYMANATMWTETAVVYAAFRADDGSCYSPPAPVMVTVNYPDLEVMIAPGLETSAVGETQTFVITVVNNGPIPAPAAQVKIPIPSQRQLVLANPSAGAYSGNTHIWEVGQLNSGQSETLTVTIRLQ